MFVLIVFILLWESSAIKLRGMINRQRQQVIESYVERYFKPINQTIINIVTLNKSNNYTFSEFGCFKLGTGMIDLRYTRSFDDICEVHRGNIEYYLNLYKREGMEYSVLNPYWNDVTHEYRMLTQYIYPDLELHNIHFNEVNQQLLLKISKEFEDITITNETVNCCKQYTITW
jgi:hypothetical protein